MEVRVRVRVRVRPRILFSHARNGGEPTVSMKSED